MKIENLRFGFACNSSSTHSVVLWPADGPKIDRLCSDGEFGWQEFVAASEGAKKSWLKTLIARRLVKVGEKTATRVAEQMFPDVPQGYIDHQSVPLIPRTYGDVEPCYEFFEELTQYVLRDGVVIHGGNDNGGPYPPESNLDWYKALPQETSDDEWIARKEGDWWILYHSGSGAKVTLSFQDDPAVREVAEVPELVDIKITDFCPYACAYCYQGSTHKGGHADNLDSWLRALQSQGVFEVAIGGGEPTLHPEFKQLFGHFRDLKINFTTRNLDWVCHNAELIRKYCGGFAFSVEEFHETRDLISTLKEYNLLNKVSFQYVMGIAGDLNFEHLVQLCKEERIRLTLLGYKTTGRGETAKKRLPRNTLQTEGGWIDFVKEHGYNLAIDTALATQVPTGTFDEHLLRRSEGTHSMYIDAVASTAGVSSYTEQVMLPLQAQGIDVVRAFGELQQQVLPPTQWERLTHSV